MKLTSKEMLLAHINTLSEQDCANIYFILTDKQREEDYVWLNDSGDIVDDDDSNNSGLIKLTPTQMGRLIHRFGVDKFKACVKILIANNIKNNFLPEYSSYRAMVGWVEKEYNRLNRWGELNCLGYTESVPPFSLVDTKEQAINWIKLVPTKYRYTDPYVFYLRNKFNVEEGV